MHRRSLPLLMPLMLLLGGCSLFAPRPVPPPAADAESPELTDIAPAREAARAEGASIYAVDNGASQVCIHVFRGGRLPTRGKNHVMTVDALQGFVALTNAPLPTDAGFMLGFAAEDLVLDDPALRAAIGGGFGKPLTAEQTAGTRENMLSDSVLDAGKHPDIVLRSRAIAGDWPMLVARVAVTLHGRTQLYDSLLEARREGDTLTAEGQLVVRQSDFGITPMSVLGGLIGLQDPLGITYRIVARRAE